MRKRAHWLTAAIADGDLPAALTGKTYNGLTPTSAAAGFTLAGGTTSSVNESTHTLTVTVKYSDGTTKTATLSLT